MESKAPCDFAKLLAGGVETMLVGVSEDLATFVDGSAFEYLLYTMTIAANSAGTGVTLRAVHADVSAGTTGLAEVKDVDGTTSLIATLDGASAPAFAVGASIALFVRTHGAKKFHSPKFTQAGGTSTDVAYQVWGINPRDTKEIRTAWTAAPTTGTIPAAAVGVVETAIA